MTDRGDQNKSHMELTERPIAAAALADMLDEHMAGEVELRVVDGDFGSSHIVVMRVEMLDFADSLSASIAADRIARVLRVAGVRAMVLEP